VKFADADLIGIPIRLTVSARSIAGGGIELKRRDRGPESASVIPPNQIVAAVRAVLDDLRSELWSAGDRR
ncbi:MAG: His/Gly/Thr/Pro-type tRNA ligase C-terminal domain-containing protein, partial [Vicinamibacterales bacterium]